MDHLIHKRLFKLGKLYYKYILDTRLEKNELTDTSEKLADILADLKIITITKDQYKRPMFYFNAGCEYGKGQMLRILSEHLTKVG